MIRVGFFSGSFDPMTNGHLDVVAREIGHGLVGRLLQHQRVAGVGDHVAAARSQPYYLDVTHPDANKGAVARALAAKYSIAPEAIATIGDMPNDVLMFAHSGLSIAMGNASPEVQRAARRVTTSNEDEGFANAVEKFILRGA